MKKSLFAEEQVAYVLKQVEPGIAVGEVCRKMGIAEATFYAIAGRGKPQAQAVGGRPEPGQGDAAGGGHKEALRLAQKRVWVGRLQERLGSSERRALRIVSMSRSAFSYTPNARESSAIRRRTHEIAQARIHYGCERVLVILRRAGWRDNHRRVHRIYREGGLVFTALPAAPQPEQPSPATAHGHSTRYPVEDGLRQ